MTRRLAAVLAADIVGYSALMAEDEAGTLEALRRLRRELFHPAVAGYRGKVVKAMGDGWLVEFTSAVDAVNCALRVQTGLEADETVRVRIGIHVGDITHEDEDIFGDGVNVAARLEALAEPGAVMISDAVYSSLDGTLTPSFDDAGEHVLKNIVRPVRVWVRRPPTGFVQNEVSVPAIGDSRNYKATISIEPIATSDGRTDVRELAAALTGDLSRYLGAGRWLQAITSERPVQGAYRLSAKLRARGDRIRLEPRLISPADAEIWADKIDGTLDDAFDWQDDTAATITAGINTVIRELEMQRLDGMDAAAMSAGAMMLRMQMCTFANRAEIETVLDLARQAIAKDPGWSLPYSTGIVYSFFAREVGWANDLLVSRAELEAWLEWAETLVQPSADEQTFLAWARHVLKPDLERDRAAITAVLHLAPFHHWALHVAGVIYLRSGEPELGLDHLRKVLPFVARTPPGATVYYGMTLCLVQLRRDEDALECAQKAVELAPSGVFALRALAVANACLGRLDEAREAAEKLLRVSPNTTVSRITSLSASAHTDTPGMQRYRDALRLAGLPEGDA